MNREPSKPITGSKFSRPRFFWSIGMVVILLASIVYVSRPPDSQQEYIARVQKLGGLVGRYELLPKIIYLLTPAQFQPYFPWGKVDSIHFDHTRVNNSEVVQTLEHFPKITHLGLGGTGISEELMKKLAEHQALKTVFLHQTNISDRGIENLCENRTITFLYLDGTGITDESISHLSKMPQLRTLTCSNTKITDASVKLLLEMPHLSCLDITGTQISDNGLRRLRQKRFLRLIPNLPNK